MDKVAKVLGVQKMEVYEVASFYTMYNRQEVGKFHLQICGTTPCQLCGSREITKVIEDYTGTTLGHTSEDKLWTLDEVECLGACANAPMIQVNNKEVYEDLNETNVIELLKSLENGTAQVGPQIKRNQAEGPQGRTSLQDKNFLESEVRHTRDFAKAKEDWEEDKRKQKEAANKKK